MKLFKKALLATAIVGAFGAQAVTVSSDKVKISKEGVAAGKVARIATTTGTDNFVLDFVVGALTPAASTITLTFDKAVDLSNVNITSSDITNDPAAGTGTVALASGNMVFDYGTGSFTFDNVSIAQDATTDQWSIKFKVNLGNPLTAASAFRLTVDGVTNGIVLAGASQVCYDSVDGAMAPIENGCSPIAELADQFAFDVTKEWDGKIERVDQVSFSRNYTGSNNMVDTLNFELTNDETLAAALTTNTDATITFNGMFDNGQAGVNAAEFTGAGTTYNALTTGVTMATDPANGTVTMTVANANVKKDGKAAGVVTFTNGSGFKIPQTGEITAVAVLEETGIAAPLTGKVSLTDAAGSWMLDATVINVPYLPVNYEGVQSSVHIANEANRAANVLMTAIDNKGTEYASVELGDVPANTVYKVSQAKLNELFGLAGASRKLSVTFNIDGYAQDVSAYAFTQNDKGRSEVSNSQLKVDGKQ